MQNDFKLVKRKRQRKQKAKLENSAEEAFCESQVTFNRKFEKALEEFKSSRFCFELLHTIESCLKFLNSSSIGEILCYGIGNFFGSKSSLHQLAALVEIHRKYNSVVVAYDPAFTTFEINTLKELNFNVLSENEEGKRKIASDKITLVYLPHCPKQLVNNFLWANWSVLLLRCILITNSFSKIIQDNTEKILKESASYILKINNKTKEIPLENNYGIENVFNDMSVHYFRLQDVNTNFFTETLDQEPFYLKDTELITRNFNNFNIKDE